MSAWTQNAPHDRWYRMDTTHPSYNAVVNACGVRHANSPRAGLLSVFPNIAGNEAIVKVADAAAVPPYTPPPAAVVQTFTPATLPILQALVASTLWRPQVTP